MAEKNIKVRKDETNPETKEVIADALIRIADAFTAMSQQGGITQDGIVALLMNMNGVRGKIGKAEIHLILDNLPRLKSYYVRKQPSKS